MTDPSRRRSHPHRPTNRWNRVASGRAKSWDNRVRHVEDLAESPGFRQLREQIIAAARLRSSDRVLDIGAGTGPLTLAAAPRAAHVIALDSSTAMFLHLETELARHSINNANVLVGDASELPLSDASVDVVLSNYCFHHLKDDDKQRALAEAIRVLRPNGRLVVGDMMFQIGFSHARDRAVMFRFARHMLRRGPAGILRLTKNAIRSLTRRGEHPATIEWWRHALDQAGFSEIVVGALQHEGGIATARRPEPNRLHAIRRPRVTDTSKPSIVRWSEPVSCSACWMSRSLSRPEYADAEPAARHRLARSRRSERPSARGLTNQHQGQSDRDHSSAGRRRAPRRDKRRLLLPGTRGY